MDLAGVAACGSRFSNLDFGVGAGGRREDSEVASSSSLSLRFLDRGKDVSAVDRIMRMKEKMSAR